MERFAWRFAVVSDWIASEYLAKTESKDGASHLDCFGIPRKDGVCHCERSEAVQFFIASVCGILMVPIDLFAKL